MIYFFLECRYFSLLIFDYFFFENAGIKLYFFIFLKIKMHRWMDKNSILFFSFSWKIMHRCMHKILLSFDFKQMHICMHKTLFFIFEWECMNERYKTILFFLVFFLNGNYTFFNEDVWMNAQNSYFSILILRECIRLYFLYFIFLLECIFKIPPMLLNVVWIPLRMYDAYANVWYMLGYMMHV